uniref:Uncharacterized protein n=1 Tax=Ascaris lumbricoides TaxID=6252 RepID=A0A0M3HT59_ASCLU
MQQGSLAKICTFAPTNITFYRKNNAQTTTLYAKVATRVAAIPAPTHPLLTNLSPLQQYPTLSEGPSHG